jgi:hypothetical protein
MTNPIPSDVYESAAVRVFKKVSLRITERLDSWDFALGVSIVNSLVEILRESREEIGDINFAFELRQTVVASGKALTAKSIVELNASEPHLIVLDQDLMIIKAVPLTLDPNTVTGVTLCATSLNTVIAEYESKSVINFYANESLVGIESLDSPGSLPPTRNRSGRRAADYELAVRDHYREWVKYWQQTDHWEDRPQRILRKQLGSKKTERIFHSSLFLWLNSNLDAQVRSEATTVESDEPDIEIAAFGGKFFVIEVKWLGTAGGKPYSRPRLVQGIGQVNTYLKKQTTVSRATLVAYDGRKREEFDALTLCELLEDGCIRLEQCDGKSLLARGSCMVLFLENKTASD